jgi:hypothetical protein
VWVVTGTDGAGVERAAQAFDAQVLRDRFAVALSPTDGALTVPLPAR